MTLNIAQTAEPRHRKQIKLAFLADGCLAAITYWAANGQHVSQGGNKNS